MKKALIILVLALMPLFASAQDSAIPLRMEIAKLEANDGQVELEAFQFIKNGEKEL